MSRRIMIESDGREVFEDESVKSQEDYTDEFIEKKMEDVEVVLRHVYTYGYNNGAACKKQAVKDAYDRGRESVFNGPGYSADLRRSKVDGYKEGYAVGYAEGLEAGRNECETGSKAETPFVEADAFHIGDEIRSLIHARERAVVVDSEGDSLVCLFADGMNGVLPKNCAEKTGRTYPWVAVILSELGRPTEIER